MAEHNILIISADEESTASLKSTLEPLGYGICVKPRLSSGIRALRDDRTLVLLPLASNGTDPLGALKELKSYHPDSYVITLNANGNSPTFSEALKEGAYCQLESPPDDVALKTALRRAFAEMAAKGELQRYHEEAGAPKAVWESPRMTKVLKAVEKASRKDSAVMVLGEPGTGKMLAARLIHLSGDHAMGPFTSLSISSAEPPEKLEAAIYKTLADAPRHHGKGGTLYISGIESIEADMEKKLLRLIKTGEFFSKEGKKITVRTRVVLGSEAPNKDRPLFQLLKQSVIKLPALKTRREDILPLSKHFLKEATEWFETGPRIFSKDAERFLVGHDWPGNVTELKDTIKRTCALSTSRTIAKKDLVLSDGTVNYSIRDFLEQKLKRYLKEMASMSSSNLYDTVLAEVEKSLIDIFLKETGSQLRTSKALGMNRNTLRAKIKKYKIKSPWKPRKAADKN